MLALADAPPDSRAVAEWQWLGRAGMGDRPGYGRFMQSIPGMSSSGGQDVRLPARKSCLRTSIEHDALRVPGAVAAAPGHRYRRRAGTRRGSASAAISCPTRWATGIPPD